MTNFLVDWTKNQCLPSATDPDYWILHFDGSKMLRLSGIVGGIPSLRGGKAQLCPLDSFHDF